LLETADSEQVSSPEPLPEPLAPERPPERPPPTEPPPPEPAPEAAPEPSPCPPLSIPIPIVIRATAPRAGVPVPVRFLLLQSSQQRFFLPLGLCHSSSINSGNYNQYLAHMRASAVLGAMRFRFWVIKSLTAEKPSLKGTLVAGAAQKSAAITDSWGNRGELASHHRRMSVCSFSARVGEAGGLSWQPRSSLTS
jgi:hypothetical protein